MMQRSARQLTFDHLTNLPVVVQPSAGQMSSDAGLLLPESITLDIDPTDDPTHGKQQLSVFHGYYEQHLPQLEPTTRHAFLA